MPAVNLPWTEVGHFGTAPAAEVTGDPVNGHSTANDGRVEVIVRNSGSTVARTVTFALTATVDGTVVPAKSYSIPFGQTRKFHGFPTALYGSTLGITVDNAELKLSAEHKVGVG